MHLSHDIIESPVGDLKLVSDDSHLLAVLWVPDRPQRVSLAPSNAHADHPILASTKLQLQQYFSGNRARFELPIRFSGTSFQKTVWESLMLIECGETWSYQRLARHIGRPTAARAVGAAVGRNPLSIVAPCHRVIGSGGQLTGFAGGLLAKTILLEIEQRHPSLSPLRSPADDGRPLLS